MGDPDERDRERTDGEADPEDPVPGSAHHSVPGPPTDREDQEFGWRGWVLVGVLVVSLVVVPWAIVLLPDVQNWLGSLGLGLRDAYLTLPLVPAILLGAVAVWSAVATRRDGSDEE